MPIYEYRCERGHRFDALQKFADAPLTVCQECGAPVERVLHPVAIHFKGSGFYSTDYGRGKKKPEGAKGESSASTSGGAGGTSGDSKPSQAGTAGSGSSGSSASSDTGGSSGSGSGSTSTT